MLHPRGVGPRPQAGRVRWCALRPPDLRHGGSVSSGELFLANLPQYPGLVNQPQVLSIYNYDEDVRPADSATNEATQARAKVASSEYHSSGQRHAPNKAVRRGRQSSTIARCRLTGSKLPDIAASAANHWRYERDLRCRHRYAAPSRIVPATVSITRRDPSCWCFASFSRRGTCSC